MAPINRIGPHLETTGDFTVTTTLEAGKLTSEATSMQLVGTLASGEWWRGLKRLDIVLRQGRVDVNMYLGDSPSPARSKSFPAPDLPPKVEIVVRKSAQAFLVTINGMRFGPLDDPGIFAAGMVYFGFQVPPHNQLTVYNLTVSTPADGASTSRIAGAQVAPIPQSPAPGALRELAQARGIMIGSQVGGERETRTDARYWELALQEFNIWTVNQYYFTVVHPQPGRYNFCYGDFLVRQAQANHIPVRGHTLVWHNALPDWIAKGTFTRDELMAVLKDHIQTVVSRYRGQIYAWDVVNEALNDDGTLRKTIWQQTIGPDYLEMAFRWAHEADPQAKLFYNDYNAEGSGKKSDGVYQLVKQLKDKGVPIDGVGLQMHLVEGKPISAADLAANIKRLGALGLEVHITEMDVRIQGQANAARLASQATTYHDALAACLSVSACKAFVMWGFTDKHSWITGSFPGYGEATIYDAQYAPKPAFQGLVDALQPGPARSEAQKPLSGRLVAVDDFSDPANGLFLNNQKGSGIEKLTNGGSASYNWDYSYSDHSLVMHVTGYPDGFNGWAGSVATLKGKVPADFAVEFRSQATTHGDQAVHGIHYYASPDDRFDLEIFARSAEPTTYRFWSAKERVNIINGRSPAQALGSGENLVRLEVKADAVTLFINGQLVGQAKDPGLKQRAGGGNLELFWSRTGPLVGGDLEVRFSDFKVYDLGAAAPSVSQ